MNGGMPAGFNAYSISSGEGKHRIIGNLNCTGNGLVIQIMGGELPHVGTVVLCQPRPSLDDKNVISVTSSTLNLLHHKDDEVARPIGEKIARELNQVVVAIAGIHVDEADENDIKLLMRNAFYVADMLLDMATKGI